ncbi:hypothetical protein O7N91_005036 [Salmonella enterica]|nr:hypothetical protein [Salmonella enterica]
MAEGTEAKVLRPAQKRQAVHFLMEALPYQHPAGMQATDAEQSRLPLAEPA